MQYLEHMLGLLDAVFSYLNIYYPTSDEKMKAREAVEALARHWRKNGLNVTLKAHIMEKHVCDFNDKYGIGNKEESFIEQGHQVGIKDNRRYQGLTDFEKKTISTMKARSVASHPLVRINQQNIHQNTRQKRIETLIKSEDRTKKVCRQNVKDEKESKRQHYVSTNK
jgi:hypothetical protein